MPPPPRRRFGWGALVGAFVAGCLIASVVVLVGVAVVSVLGPDPLGGSYGPVGEGAPVPEVGDCFEAAPGPAVIADGDEPVDCDELHGTEVFGVYPAPAGAGDRAPGEGYWRALARGVCPAAFLAYVGRDHEASELTWEAIVPNADAWDAGDRRLFCLIDSEGHREGYGSVEGTG